MRATIRGEVYGIFIWVVLLLIYVSGGIFADCSSNLHTRPSIFSGECVNIYQSISSYLMQIIGFPILLIIKLFGVVNLQLQNVLISVGSAFCFALWGYIVGLIYDYIKYNRYKKK